MLLKLPHASMASLFVSASEASTCTVQDPAGGLSLFLVLLKLSHALCRTQWGG